ncbi:uncharacterized protein gpsm3 [Genypterus blacodes]|uniref:uncharacterized protein gpsm3 n=1 Tax=Genypterus blacodes TaxID=154954 RepID=UPI003F76D423
MAEGGQLEPLIITEDGDITEGLPEKRVVSTLTVYISSNKEDSALKEEGHACKDKNEENPERKMCLLEQQAMTVEDQRRELVVEEEVHQADKSEANETINNGQHRDVGGSEAQATVRMRSEEKPEKPKDTDRETVTPTEPQVNIKGQDSSEQQPGGTEMQQEDLKKAHRLTPDFPESLYELLCTLQEGRRFNDQRCSFRLEGGNRRRRCHSEPNTNKPASRVVFSSLTSLQKEEFFEFVATTQARRLDDQRALLESSLPPKPKARGFRGSLKQISFVRKPSQPAAPVPVPKEDLYNMILTTQAQGRLEEQRSRAPGPMDDEDFFSLLLRVQGGRMEEQRTELPCILQT